MANTGDARAVLAEVSAFLADTFLGRLFYNTALQSFTLALRKPLSRYPFPVFPLLSPPTTPKHIKRLLWTG